MPPSLALSMPLLYLMHTPFSTIHIKASLNPTRDVSDKLDTSFGINEQRLRCCGLSRRDRSTEHHEYFSGRPDDGC